MLPKKSKSIYTQLANKYNLPYQVIEVICNHPFKFAVDRISDPEDDRAIMFSYLCKLKLKKRYKNELEIKSTDRESETSTVD